MLSLNDLTRTLEDDSYVEMVQYFVVELLLSHEVQRVKNDETLSSTHGSLLVSHYLAVSPSSKEEVLRKASW